MKIERLAISMAGILVMMACMLYVSTAEAGDKYDLLLNFVEDKIKRWQWYFWISLIATIAVGLLGLIITLLQSIDQAKYKTHIICLGTLISASTFLTNTFLTGNFRTYERIEQEALLKQLEMVNWIEIYRGERNEANKAAAEQKISEAYNAITALENSLISSKTNAIASAGAGLNLIDAAYAGGEPAWISSIPEDSNYLYFVGFADSDMLAGLDVKAQSNAMQSAANYMSGEFSQEAKKIDAEKMAKFLANATEPFSSYISHDAKSGLYRYYSLIRISKNAMKNSVVLFGVQNRVAISEALLNKIDVSQRARDDYTSRQTQLYEKLEDQTRAKLDRATYLKFLKARQLRKEEKKYPEAVALLKEIVQEAPDFYLGWYNLALAGDAANDMALAEQAYQRAIALEKGLAVRDATLYNSYGHFFYKQKKYQDAVTQYNQSLSLDPTNPRTQNNLSQATKGLTQVPR